LSCDLTNSCTPSETSTVSGNFRNTSNDTFSNPNIATRPVVQHPRTYYITHSSRPARHSRPISRIRPYIDRVSYAIYFSHTPRLWLRSCSSSLLVSGRRF
jgi:hypothetical protein